ncbi:hypothetical protein BgiMline_021362 [Biomphalaria glabrata]
MSLCRVMEHGRGVVSCQKNGVATVLSINPGGAPKVIGTFTSSNYCDKCCKSKKKLTPEQFVAWKANHAAECDANHTGSSISMESQGILQTFQRSQMYGLNYTGYLGDGDSKSYKTVADAPVRRLKSWNAAVMYRKEWDVDLWTQRILTKEKGTFFDLSNILGLDVQRCYYGSEHGYSESDGETGVNFVNHQSTSVELPNFLDPPNQASNPSPPLTSDHLVRQHLGKQQKGKQCLQKFTLHLR